MVEPDRLPAGGMHDRIAAAQSVAVAIARGDGDAPPLDLTLLDERDWSTTNGDRKWDTLYSVHPGLSALSVRGLPPGQTDKVQRSQVFALASSLPLDPSDDQVRDFVVHVNAWGYGARGYAEHRTRQVIDQCGAPGKGHAFPSSARSTLQILRNEMDLYEVDPAVAGYYFLNNWSAGHVKNWGPAFFTKFLYFADPRNLPGQPGGALILDAVMVGHLGRLVPSLRTNRPPGRFANTGWTTPQYAFYLTFMRDLSEKIASQRPERSGMRPDRVEAVLFRTDSTS